MSLSLPQRVKWACGPGTGLRAFNLPNSGVLYPTRFAEFAVDAARVIAVGDALLLSTDDVRKASSASDAGTAAANQEAFHDIFAGIALEAHTADDSAGIIGVATAGMVVYPCASATFVTGDCLGMSENAGGDALEDQKLIGVATPNLAIGRCMKGGSALTLVYCEFVSTVMFGGPQLLV